MAILPVLNEGDPGPAGSPGVVGPQGPAGPSTQSFTLPIGDGASVIPLGPYFDLRFGHDAELESVTLLAQRPLPDPTGSIVIDIQRATFAAYPTFTSITAAAKPTLSAAIKYEDSTLAGWTTTIVAGDILRFVVDSVSAITLLGVTLIYTRTS